MKSSEFCAPDLLELVERQTCNAPMTKRLEDALLIGPGYGSAWYSSQREHCIRWLAEYHTSGPYGRKPVQRTPAKVVYGRVNCPPMVFWLAETFSVDETYLRAAHNAALVAPRIQASQAGAIRAALPWELIFPRLASS